MDLENLRDEIDTIDKQLVELFLKRMNIVKGVAEYKIENNMEIFHPERELAVIEKAKGRSTKEMEIYVEDFFTKTMEVSRRMQKDIIDNQ